MNNNFCCSTHVITMSFYSLSIWNIDFSLKSLPVLNYHHAPHCRIAIPVFVKHIAETLTDSTYGYWYIFLYLWLTVAKPQLDMFVVCKTNYYLGHIQLEDNEDGPSEWLFINSYLDWNLLFSSCTYWFQCPYDRVNQRPLEEPFEMEPDVLYFVRYKAIKRFVEEGRIDLFWAP